jgi:hypothetical protein
MTVTDTSAAALREAAVPRAVVIIRALRRLPLADQTELVRVARRGAGDVHYRDERRARLGLAEFHGDLTGLRRMAGPVGEFLSKNYDVTLISLGGGIVLDSDVETVGGRFLGRLVDTVLQNRRAIPRQVVRPLERVCEAFRGQLLGRARVVEYVYPVALVGLPVDRVTLAANTTLRRATDRDLTELARHTEHLLSTLDRHHLLSRTLTTLSIHQQVLGADLPFMAYTGSPDVQKARIALALADAGPAIIPA